MDVEHLSNFASSCSGLHRSEVRYWHRCGEGSENLPIAIHAGSIAKDKQHLESIIGRHDESPELRRDGVRQYNRFNDRRPLAPCPDICRYTIGYVQYH